MMLFCFVLLSNELADLQNEAPNYVFFQASAWMIHNHLAPSLKPPLIADVVIFGFLGVVTLSPAYKHRLNIPELIPYWCISILV